MTDLNRRDFNKLVLAAVGGAVAGASLAGCENKPAPPETPKGGDGKTPPKESGTPMAKHACKGMNECKGQGACKTEANACKGQNACKSKGGCATVEKHACGGKNECKGQGGCKTADHDCAGKNECKGKGGCAVPVKMK